MGTWGSLAPSQPTARQYRAKNAFSAFYSYFSRCRRPNMTKHPRHLEWNLAYKLSVRSLCPWTGGIKCLPRLFHCSNNWEESKIIKDHLSNQACQAGQKRSHRCRAQAKMLKAPHLGSRRCVSWWFERFPEVESYKINWIPMTPMTD